VWTFVYAVPVEPELPLLLLLPGLPGLPGLLELQVLQVLVPHSLPVFLVEPLFQALPLLAVDHQILLLAQPQSH
jgi:hypothetical protein